MKLILRDYKSSDKRLVNELALAAFAQYSDKYEDWQEFRGKIGKMAALAESAEIIVAEMGAHIIGAVVYVGPNKPRADMFYPEWAIIRMLVVSPDARGQGVGRALTEACLIRAKRDQAETVALHTSEIMHAALHIYRKLGFIFHSEVPDIHGVKYGLYTKRLENG